MSVSASFLGSKWLMVFRRALLHTGTARLLLNVFRPHHECRLLY